jgi:pyruvate formate lyase activating enzyme
VVEKLGNDVPVHFSRFHPDYKMNDVPRTPMETLINSYNIAKETGILYPYLGNIANEDYENTKCPKCGNVVIKRNFFSVNLEGISKNKCKKCGYEISLV